MRDRLIELLKDSCKYDSCLGKQDTDICKDCRIGGELADHLLANGVIVIDTAVVSADNRPLISQCLGRPLDEIIELVQAKEDGRIIVPPCKVGQMVYQTDGTRIYESCITHIEIYSFATVFYTDGVTFDETAIGQSIYLTREQAEKALAERSLRIYDR